MASGASVQATARGLAVCGRLWAATKLAAPKESLLTGYNMSDLWLVVYSDKILVVVSCPEMFAQKPGTLLFCCLESSCLLLCCSVVPWKCLPQSLPPPLFFTKPRACPCPELIRVHVLVKSAIRCSVFSSSSFCEDKRTSDHRLFPALFPFHSLVFVPLLDDKRVKGDGLGTSCQSLNSFWNSTLLVHIVNSMGFSCRLYLTYES